MLIALAVVALVAIRFFFAGRPAASAGDISPAFTLRPIANLCSAGSCPTVYEFDADQRRDSGRLIVQGFTVSAAQAGIDVPDGEALVEVPLDLLKEALQKLA
ncbi:hypothetical protein [Actinoplanes sp. GCM10030250]|uniref:hypothetical protein n=1 Tax=Actinoplanes sp. GCM10030250 TaxID=3273376 RepID=UPI00360AB2A5